MPERVSAERALNFFGFFLILVFLILAPFPVIGYLTGIAAMASVIMFTFTRKQTLLVIGSGFSLIMASLLYGPSWFLLGFWAVTIVPGTILGGLLLGGRSLPRAFTVALIVSALISLMIFVGEKDLIMKAMDGLQGLMPLPTGASTTPPEGLAAETADIMATMLSLMKRLMPALLALSGVAQLFIAGVFVFYLLRRYGEYAPSFISYIYWKMPYRYIYPVGAVVMMRLLGTPELKLAADNLLFFIGAFYAVFGFSVLEYVLRKIRFPMFMRIIFYIAVAFLYLPGLILAGALGLFDSYFDFRQVKAKVIG